MVWLEKADAQALSTTPNLWNQIRDGQPTSQLPRTTFGFRVTKPFTSPILKSKFQPGMQGQVLHCEGSGAYVQVRDLFDAQGQPLKDWISRKVIEIGTQPYGTWKIDMCLIPRTSSKLTPNELNLLKDPKCKHLALGISTFLRKLAQTKPEGLTSENLDRLGGQPGTKVSWITARVVEGVNKAGVLSVLNNPQFTIEELVAKTTLDCASREARDQAGFYFRRYIARHPQQLKKHCDFYVGQARDLYVCHKKWMQKLQHEDLIENAESVDMRAICLVPKVFYDDYKYIVEQVFTSLFETYKKALFDKTKAADMDDIRSNFHMSAFHDMHGIAREAAQESGWTGAVLRRSFWESSYASCAGLNYQSPMVEAPVQEGYVWLRTDGYMPDELGNSVPISNFTREVPRRMTVVTPSRKSASKEQFFIILCLSSEMKEWRFRIARTIKNDSFQDGVEWPAENTLFNVTFEVRTDWKPHPYSWARLPLFGPFEDWDRANSWALSIDWTDASGQHRSKYLNCERPHMMMNSESNGSIQPYARGIEVIHWLFRERIPAAHQHRWLEIPPLARVKVIKHDHFNQSITIADPGSFTTTAPISSKRKHPDVIKAEMEGHGVHGDAKLANVGLTMAEARKVTVEKFGTRRKCDTCLFLSRGTGGGCVATESKVCGNCLKFFGRPFCSWTPSIPGVFVTGENGLGNTFEQLESRGDALNAFRREALYGLRGWTGNAMLSADPLIMEIDAGEDVDETELVAAEAEADEIDRDWVGP